MFNAKPKRKIKPSSPQQRFMVAAIGAGCLVLGIVIGIVTTLSNTPKINRVPVSNSIMQLNVAPSPPASPVNLYLAQPGDSPDDMAWNRPTYASSFWENGYPSRATNGADGQPGSDMWRSAGSTGTWFYVDLGEAKTFSHLTTTLFVDAHYTNAPKTSFIISDDLMNWQVIYTEVNPLNSVNRWKPRDIFLDEPVTARYVGLYAVDWNGGWGDMHLFMVQP